MRTRPSTAPIALLLTAGLICLAISAVIPTTTVAQSAPSMTAAGQASVPYTVVTHTDQVSVAIAIGLVVLAVSSFAGAGWLTYRRRAAGRQAR